MHPITLMVVDDAITILTLVDNLFKRSYDVIKCNSVEDAMEVLTESIPDVIISDLNMPGTTGEEFVKVLKSDPKYKSIPILILSSIQDVYTRIRLLQLGAEDYVQKPFNPEELRLRIEIILRRGGKAE